MLDTSCLKPNESYLELPEIYIVFICTFDPFGYDLPIYTFKSKCQEKENIVYIDGVHRIFFNTTAGLSDLPLDMRNMLEYINSGIVNDEATKEIDSAVKEARLNAEWKEEYMRTLTYQNEVYSEGKEEGSFNATLNNINSVMKSLNKPFDEVCVIMNVQDKETYRKYIDSDTSKSAKAQDN